MLNFEHNIPTQICFGQGQIEILPELLDCYGKNVLLAYGGGSIKKTGLYDEIMELLSNGDFNIIELSGIEPNPKISSVEKGVDLCRANGVDVILAVGGGSTIDCCKAIACGVYYDGNMWEMVENAEGFDEYLPIVDIVTIAATGSEYDSYAVITNPETNEKLDAPFCYPSVSICDPTYTFTVPPYQTAAGTADIMSHIFEGYFSRTDDTDLFIGMSETVLKSCIKNLPIVLNNPEDYSARANLMMNATIACSGIPEYGKIPSGWACHVMEHELSAYYDITHGAGLAMLTPKWMRYIIEKDNTVVPRFVKYAENVWGITEGTDMEKSLASIDKTEEFFRSANLPMTMGEFGIGEEHFYDMAKHACRSDLLADAYVPLDVEDVVNIFKACI
ncbi:MAG: iron-containing alcohol dehydrogenase [Clostridia bacterium]|nr:iron-containing alcohol dehydrogenase [Clostridia bacterium]